MEKWSSRTEQEGRGLSVSASVVPGQPGGPCVALGVTVTGNVTGSVVTDLTLDDPPRLLDVGGIFTRHMFPAGLSHGLSGVGGSRSGVAGGIQ